MLEPEKEILPWETEFEIGNNPRLSGPIYICGFQQNATILP